MIRAMYLVVSKQNRDNQYNEETRMSTKFQHDIWQIRLACSRITNKRKELWRIMVREGYTIPTKKGTRFICTNHNSFIIPEHCLGIGLANARKRIERRGFQLKVFRNHKSMGKQLLQHLQEETENIPDIRVVGFCKPSIEYKGVPIPFLHPNFPNRGAIMLLLEARAEQLLPDERDAVRKGIEEVKNKFKKIKHLL